MKTINFLAIIFVLFFVSIISCSSSKNDNQNSTETTQNTSEKVLMAVESGAPAPEISEQGTPENVAKGEKLFKEKNCNVCHQLDTKLVGPSMKEISKAYAGNNEKLNSFLKGNSKSIIDPAQHAIMEPQIAITKAMSEAERVAIVEYILSIKY
jgi:cytochrome c